MAAAPNIFIELQPLLPDHSAVTDFLFLSRDRADSGESTPLAFIRPEITTNLKVKSDASGQALREAHILLEKCKSEEKLPFVLTNSFLLSFGLAKKHGVNHISVVDHFTLFVPVDQDVTRMEVKKLIYILSASGAVDRSSPAFVDQPLGVTLQWTTKMLMY